MKINAALIEQFKLCKDRFDNFKHHYSAFDDSFSEFLKLDNITYNDKVWVGVRLLTRNQLVHWSIFCAESVKHIFEDKYPENKCLTILFDYLKSGLDFENLTDEERQKIWDLRRATATVVVDDAAYVAAYAAYATATVAVDADADAAYDAAYATAYAYAADTAREEQRNLNLLYLASLIEE